MFAFVKIYSCSLPNLFVVPPSYCTASNTPANLYDYVRVSAQEAQMHLLWVCMIACIVVLQPNGAVALARYATRPKT